MKISILIVSLHPGPALEESLASLRQQTHADWEVIVASSASAHLAEASVREFGAATARSALHRLLPDNTNIGAARNQLLALATGDPVALLEPGDTWSPRHLANALRELRAGADLAVSDVRTSGRLGGDASHETSVPAALIANPTRTLFTREAIGPASAVVFRREQAARIGGFDERFLTGDARDFWLRCALQGMRFNATREVTCRWAALHQPDEALVAEDAVLFYEKHRDLAAIPSAMRRRLLAASLVAHGKLLRNSDPARAARCFWRAWSLQPVHVQTLGQFALTGWRSGPPPGPDVRHPTNSLGNGNS